MNLISIHFSLLILLIGFLFTAAAIITIISTDFVLCLGFFLKSLSFYTSAVLTYLLNKMPGYLWNN